jgi:KaiC/GvpD/RAD55 family RecA-like ATPase
MTTVGIPGLDEMIEGGIPDGYSILVTGGPGTGKSTLAMQFLYEGERTFGEKGLYITFEENPVNMRRNFSKYGWELDDVEILCLKPKRVEPVDKKGEDSFIIPWSAYTGKKDSKFPMSAFSIKDVKSLIKKKAEETGIERLVLDSLSSLVLLEQDKFKVRQEIHEIIDMLEELGCTSLILTEMPGGTEGLSKFGVEEFLLQGVVVIYNTRKGSKRVRGLEVLKMRGTKHSDKICLMEMTDRGIVVYPEESLFSE